ncbi:hypothetical protein [Acidithiobacillus thiooxidans]|uniref:hypothetical protein n=1 Tax=Acidithiobacillus thiooxidans TaxID=930 RepID=UPI001C06FD4D|nr:hypothetical protein [Acidithiobacillus thiooxidans]MBU2843547.1 hypothetical protein [Acidithiobacillus thiooxidans]
MENVNDEMMKHVMEFVNTADDDVHASTSIKLDKADGLEISELVNFAFVNFTNPFNDDPQRVIDLDRKIDILLPDALTARILVMIRDTECQLLNRCDQMEKRIMERIAEMEERIMNKK